MEAKAIVRADGKTITFTVLCLAYALQMTLGIQAGYTDYSILPHILFSFFHANVFHLAANLLTATMLHYTFRDFVISYMLTVALSFFAVTELPTMGFSGILYVMIGINSNLFHGRFGFWKGWFVMFLLVGLVCPHMNGLLHLLCFVSGLVIQFIRKTKHDYAKAGR